MTVYARNSKLPHGVDKFSAFSGSQRVCLTCIARYHQYYHVQTMPCGCHSHDPHNDLCRLTGVLPSPAHLLYHSTWSFQRSVGGAAARVSQALALSAAQRQGSPQQCARTSAGAVLSPPIAPHHSMAALHMSQCFSEFALNPCA